MIAQESNTTARLVRRVNHTFALALLVIWFLNLPAQAEESEPATIKITTGFDYSSGDYGDSGDTEIWYVPFSVSYQRFPWKAKVNVPWLQIDGPGGVIGGGDSGIVVGPGATETSASGLGDIIASLQYSVEAIPADMMYLDLTAKIKFPTADEDDNLGTGEFDYTFQADLAKSLGAFTPLATLGYKIKTDSDELKLDNVWFASVGADYRLSERSNFGATIDFQEAATSSSDDAVELFTYLSHKLTTHWSLTGYGYFGFSDGSPDEGLGLQISYRY